MQATYPGIWAFDLAGPAVVERLEMRRFLDPGVAIGALGALAIVAVLALVGVFEGEQGGGGSGGAGVSPALGLEGGERVQRIYEDLNGGVVFIQARIGGEQLSPFGAPQPQQGVATGTGFLIDDEGLIVTNAHVVENAVEVALRAADDRVIPAEVVGVDISTDLAVLRVDPEALDARPLPLGDVDGVAVGDPVVAMGNPFGLDDTITAGIVSAKQRRISAPDGFTIQDVIQTDAAVNPGNSGGPLIDLAGRVIGVNSQIATGGQAQQFAGIAFAIPVSTVREIVPDLLDDGEVSRPYLGVTPLDVPPRLAESLGLEEPGGAYVYSVERGSPADQAGLEGDRAATQGALLGGGDVVLAVGGEEVGNVGDLRAALADQEIGDEVTLTVLRDGERREIPVTPESRPGEGG